MYEAGIATAQLNQIDPQVVELTPDTAPDGCYFIGATSGKVYRMVSWIDPAQQIYNLRCWRGERANSFDFIRQYPEPDGVNCADMRTQAQGPQAVIIVGPELLEDALEPLGQVAAEEVFPVGPDLPGESDSVVEVAPGPLEEELETMALEAAQREEETESFEEALDEYEQMPFALPTEGAEEPVEDEDPAPLEGIPAVVAAIEWDPENDSKMDYMRSLARVLRDNQMTVSLAEMVPWAVAAGVWPDETMAARSLRTYWRDYLKNDPSFQKQGRKIIPPALTHAARPVVQEAQPTRSEVVAQSAAGAEFGEGVARRRLGLVDQETADVMVTFSVPLRLLTPEGLEVLREQFCEVGA